MNVLLTCIQEFLTTHNCLCSHCPSSMELEIGGTHSDLTLESWFASDASTGYLEDAIVGWDIWCKQQTLPSYSQDQKKSQYLVGHEDPFPTFSSTAAQMLHDHKKFITRNLSSSQNQTHAAAAKHDSAQKKCASTESSDENDASVPSTTFLKRSYLIYVLLSLFSSGGSWKKIAYPFELVKPGGVEGETTLKDINHQMLMNPSKPIPHPVGDLVTHPCISTSGFGISGKKVAALTRIHTKGRGSITIVRTKG
ncbi:uncharacterized protein LOC130726362 isoform X2 [Lotus japonicus]|uniref:uncharacterized protein LOC130726362 isoform X2 n=1 Tax=Lotus japonicus TaxID=34305 RepID=UPI002583A913|nr:uncharacterized protein LOC130726362 isoform X2 [Lotus japonicus]